MRIDRTLSVCALLLIAGCIVFTYLPSIQDPLYKADDYLFLSQVTRHGLAKSLIIPWKDHVLPLYRIFMGGLHLSFGNAVPLRIGILAFHIFNAFLIFHIVRTHTGSIVLSTFASATYGLSRQASWAAPVFCTS